MFRKRNAIVRTKKYGKLVRLLAIFISVVIVAGGIAYAWQQYEEKKYPEGTERDYSLPNAFLSFARLVTDFINQNKEEEAPDNEIKETDDKEEDVIIVVGDDDTQQSGSEEKEIEIEPEIRGGIVKKGAAEGYYSFEGSLFVGDYFAAQADINEYFQYSEYAAITGLDMNTILTKKALKNSEGESITLSQYSGTFENIEAVYIVFFAESVSWMDCPTFVKKYTAFVEEVMAQHPEAHIYVQPILPINEEKAVKRGYSVTNEKIDQINSYIYEFAEENNIWILDIAGIFKGKDGELPPELTTNGIRLEKAAYDMWAEYITTHKAH